MLDKLQNDNIGMIVFAGDVMSMAHNELTMQQPSSSGCDLIRRWFLSGDLGISAIRLQ
jgi:hypothetical protein